jgi:coiled-coil domain-containing protein 130
MYRLEHGIADKKISQDATPHITQLQKLNNSQWSDPYARSKQLRRKFREEKKLDKATQEENNKIKDKLSLAIDLVPEIAKDTIQAQSIEYGASSDELHNRALERVVAPLFNNTSKASNTSDLRNMATVRTRLKTDPFYNPDGFKLKKKEDKSSSATAVQNKDLLALKPAVKKQKASQSTDGKEEVVTTGLVAYPDSDSDASE